MKKNIIFVSSLIILLFFVYFTVQFLIPLPIGNKNIEIQIPEGCTFRQAVEILSSENLIRDKNMFIIIGRITGLDRKIRYGYYSISGTISPLDIFNMLKNGQIIEYEITVLKGDSLIEISKKLSEKGIISQAEFMKVSSDEDFLSFYDIDAPSFEGYLYPDTYKIPKGMSPENVIGMMINRMREIISTELYQRASDIGLSEREFLTLASIIEKEAITDGERPIISAVYHNRLRKGIKLQADPTAIYGVKSFRERITLKDLCRKTKYNTYVIKGLPPGPIASPGYKSIVAALYPSDVPYLYFVSNNDGTHHFSVTAKEHEAAVRKYRKKKEMENKKGSEKSAGNNEIS